MTDAELKKEIKKLQDYIVILTNHNKRIIEQNKNLQKELRELTKK